MQYQQNIKTRASSFFVNDNALVMLKAGNVIKQTPLKVIILFLERSDFFMLNYTKKGYQSFL